MGRNRNCFRSRCRILQTRYFHQSSFTPWSHRLQITIVETSPILQIRYSSTSTDLSHPIGLSGPILRIKWTPRSNTKAHIMVGTLYFYKWSPISNLLPSVVLGSNNSSSSLDSFMPNFPQTPSAPPSEEEHLPHPNIHEADKEVESDMNGKFYWPLWSSMPNILHWSRSFVKKKTPRVWRPSFPWREGERYIPSISSELTNVTISDMDLRRISPWKRQLFQSRERM